MVMSALPPKADMCSALAYVQLWAKWTFAKYLSGERNRLRLRGQRRCASGTAELGSCLTDATHEGRSRRAVRKFAAMPVPERLH